MSIKEMEKYNNYKCPCGKIHSFSSEVVTGIKILDQLPSLCDKFSAHKIFVLCDKNTYKAAGEKVVEILKEADKEVDLFTYSAEKVLPDETSVGLAVMHFDPKSDLIIGVGSGVINDIGKVVAKVTGKPYFIVATAPSMDGYASATSSVEREGIKLSLNSKCPEVILGDFEILSAAPLKAMLSGLGDMLAKYIAVTEWKITNIINGEYYCDEIASLVRLALNKCVSNADKLLQRDKEAVKSVFEGLIISGAAMEYAGLSRPASGVEHYISHVLDMRSVAFKTPVETHGIQCAIGTLYALKMYEHLKKQTPNREKALAFVKSYDYSKHTEFLREFIGQSAEILIKLEKKEQKYNPTLHERRLDVIINNWNTILETINKELPPYEDILNLWKGLGGPVCLEDIGVDNALLPQIFSATKDIRNKYCLSFLAWDLGLTDELLKII